MPQSLTDRAIQSLKPKAAAYQVADAKLPGLTLRVLPSGARTWSYRYRLGRAFKRVAIGPYPSIGLADARDKAGDHLRAVRKEGRDPSSEKRAAREAQPDTFAALCDRYIEQHAKPRKRSWKDDQRMLANDVPRSWRQHSVREIARRDVRELIEAKAVETPIQANRLRALLHKLFAFALQRELVDFNPVTGTPRPGLERQRQRVLSDDEIRAFWEATQGMEPPMRAFWRLRLITAQRCAEVGNMTWADLDLANALWTIPGSAAKNGLAHRVPLSALALDVIGELAPASAYVVAGARGKRQQAEAAALIGLPDFEGHDLRRTAASGMAAAGVQRLHIGKVLNHAERGVTAVYDRHGYDPEKRAALDTWARRLAAILDRATGGDVLHFVRSGDSATLAEARA